MRYALPLVVLAFIGWLTYQPSFGVATIEDAQEAYFSKHGKYLQVLKDNKLPDGGAVAEKLGRTLPATTQVHVYESPKGKGYQIITEDADNIYSKGFGVEAASRTWTRVKEQPVASST